ncbi:MAG TPA: polysaccharide deacetylase family protein [bacterium]
MNQWRYYVPILAYHRVGGMRGDHVPTVSAEAFEQQMGSLARSGLRVLPLGELGELVKRDGAMPRRSAVITFDDGYEETWSIAWPILKRFNLPATVFISSGEIGLPGFMSWEQVSAMANGGVTIGSHTMHHQYLPILEESRLEEELAGSKRAIEERIGMAADWLSYPIGGYSSKIQEIAKSAGYRGACTTNRVALQGPLDRYALRRIKVTDRDAHPLLMRAKLSGYYDAFRRLEKPN